LRQASTVGDREISKFSLPRFSKISFVSDRDEPDCEPFRNYLSERAATPGSILPSRNSSDAPPPVDTCETLSATPAFFTAEAESPPPITVVAPFSVASARMFAIRQVPFEVSSIDYKIDDFMVEDLLEGVRTLFPVVNPIDLKLDYAGIRPKILKDGVLHKDFWIKDSRDHKIKGYIEVCGFESPGLTAAPALAKYISSLF